MCDGRWRTWPRCGPCRCDDSEISPLGATAISSPNLTAHSDGFTVWYPADGESVENSGALTCNADKDYDG